MFSSRNSVTQATFTVLKFFFQFKITHFDTEYDQYCGLDKLHVYADVPENFGGRKNENQNRIARVCGGQSGPKFQQHNFFGTWLNFFDQISCFV